MKTLFDPIPGIQRQSLMLEDSISISSLLDTWGAVSCKQFCKQCVRINNTYSSFENIISGVPQGFILGPLSFNISINNLFFFKTVSVVHSFADDNTFSAWASSTLDYVNILEAKYFG